MRDNSENLRIYCDFDGTITIADAVDVLLEYLADPSWRDVEERWASGEIGSRECLAKQIPLIKGGWQAIEEVLAQVQVDPTFREFSRWCRESGIPLYVVSEGLDRVISFLLIREGIHVDKIYANHLVLGKDGALRLEFPSPPRVSSCRAGLCKCRLLGRGTNVVIGDGLSDLCWAPKADILFAKSKLYDHCVADGVECHAFKDFLSIRCRLEEFVEVAPQKKIAVT